MELTAGDIAEWVSGVGSLLAVIVALWFSMQSRRDLQYERLLQVTAWVENVEGQEGWKLVTQNSTQQPIFSWVCTIKWQTADGRNCSYVATQANAGIIPPGHSEFEWTPDDEPQGEAGIRTSLTFLDSMGRTWTRLDTGRLVRATTKNTILLSGLSEVSK
jgi:hypothetical protein